MATGFMPYLLAQSRDVFANATPSKKITPPGFLKMLLSNDKPKIITDVNNLIDDGSGHVRDVQIKYRTRVPAGKTRTADDCSIDSMPAYKEQTVNLTKFRAYDIHFDDATIAKYEKEASANSGQGNPSIGIMKDVWDSVMEAANGLFADINNDLLTSQAAAFGFNAVTASNAARTINFLLAATTNDLDSGMTRVLSDAMLNEIRPDEAVIVGSGLINNHYLQRRAVSFNQSGLNTAPLDLPTFFFDPYAQSKWGANQFGIFEKNAVQLINVNRFDGFRGGDKGITKLGTITLPVTDFMGDGMIQSFKFDYQLEYVKCPTTATVGGYGSTNVDRGWNLTLMATYDLLNIPSDAYVNTDRIYASNGSLRYVATNA